MKCPIFIEIWPGLRGSLISTSLDVRILSLSLVIDTSKSKAKPCKAMNVTSGACTQWHNWIQFTWKVFTKCRFNHQEDEKNEHNKV